MYMHTKTTPTHWLFNRRNQTLSHYGITYRIPTHFLHPPGLAVSWPWGLGAALGWTGSFYDCFHSCSLDVCIN